MSVARERFGFMKDGREAFLFTIRNFRGMAVSITNYGAVLVSLLVKEGEGSFHDVVLGYDSLEEYFQNYPMFGATVGRNANRISNALFVLDEKVYHLVKNRGCHNIHSDKENGFHKVLWDYEITGNNSVKLSYRSRDGEQGFPGMLDVSVTYHLTEGDGVIISYHAVSDKRTLLNMTNHSYFNLKGHGAGSIMDTEFMIQADAYTPVDKDIIPTGEICRVQGTPMDFNRPNRLDQVIKAEYGQLKLAGGFDHNFVIGNPHSGVRKMAEAVNSTAGVRMEVYSDLPGMQFYTGNSLKDVSGKNGAVYTKWSGFCMEPQYFPNSINTKGFEVPVINEGEEYKSTTIYQFSPFGESFEEDYT